MRSDGPPVPASFVSEDGSSEGAATAETGPTDQVVRDDLVGQASRLQSLQALRGTPVPATQHERLKSTPQKPRGQKKSKRDEKELSVAESPLTAKAKFVGVLAGTVSTRPRGASSVGTAAERKYKEMAEQRVKDMLLSCERGDVQQGKASALKRGEVEFSGLGTGGHRAHYIIAPAEMEDADDILRWMFVRQDGWRLNPPNLLLSCYGGRDHYVNWSQSDTLRSRKAWGSATPDVFGASSHAEARASRMPAETRASRRQTRKKQPEDALPPDSDDWKFRRKFKSRLNEIAAGVCQAVTECGGWFDLGRGQRGGLNEAGSLAS